MAIEADREGPVQGDSDRGDGELKRRIRAAGLRCTPARTAVLRLLAERGAPLSHAQVVEALGGAEWDRATLFRNLSDLSEHGLLTRADLGDHLWRYELRLEGGEDGHPHFLCVRCGDVKCLRGVRLEVGGRTDLPAGVRQGRVEIQLRGTCDGCAGPT